MPRVLRLINRLNLGGPTFNAAYLSRYLAPEYETLLVAGMIDDSEASSEFILNEMGLKPMYIPEMFREINFVNDSRAYIRLKKIIRDFKPDIVHTHAAKAGAIGRMAARACGVSAVVHTFHGHVFHSYFSKWKSNVFVNIERQLAKRSNRIIAISQKQKRELSDEFKICASEKIEVIPLGFDLTKFRENKEEKRKKFRQAYKVEEDEIVISIVGRLVPVKNHRLFLSAIASVSKKTPKKIRAFIVGGGEEWNALHEYSRMLSLNNNNNTNRKTGNPTITFTSWIKEVDEVYAGSDIVALSSLNEGTPVSIIEALAGGKAIVTTDVGGISDIVLQGVNGFIVPSGDQSSFSEALLKLIENPSLREAMENNDSDSVYEKFSYQRLVEETRALYTRLI